jgi:hypothetical protein
MITYDRKTQAGIRVNLEGKHVGDIREVAATKDSLGGWRYKPKGSKNFGETFLTIAEVKASIESDA